MFIRVLFATIILAVACDPPTDKTEARNVPLVGLDTQTAKVDHDVVAADILDKCLEGYPAKLTLEVVDGPDIHDYWRYRFELSGKAHHDQVACLRELVMLEQP